MPLEADLEIVENSGLVKKRQWREIIFSYQNIGVSEWRKIIVRFDLQYPRLIRFLRAHLQRCLILPVVLQEHGTFPHFLWMRHPYSAVLRSIVVFCINKVLSVLLYSLITNAVHPCLLIPTVYKIIKKSIIARGYWSWIYLC